MCPVRTYEIWPAEHDWLRRYFVFERATYVLEEIVAAGICIYISKIYRLKSGLCNKLCNRF